MTIRKTMNNIIISALAISVYTFEKEMEMMSKQQLSLLNNNRQRSYACPARVIVI